MELTGDIILIGETKTFGSNGFRKREVVIKTLDQYPQEILIEFIQDKCDLLNSYEVGSNVEIAININGRSWTNPQGEVKYFNTIQGWRIKQTGEGQQEGAPPVPPMEAFEPADDLNEEEDSDLLLNGNIFIEFYFSCLTEYTILKYKLRIFYLRAKKKYPKNLNSKKVIMRELIQLVNDWAREKGIFKKATPLAQMEKTFEECHELQEALYFQNNGVDGYTNSKGKEVSTDEEIMDAIGDICVTLIIQCEMQSMDIEDCIESAYEVIKDRKGKMIDGKFVKE